MESIRLTRDLTPFHVELEEACKVDIFGLNYRQIRDRVRRGQYLAVNIEEQAIAVLEIRTLKEGKSLSVVAIGGHAMPRWIGRLVTFLNDLAKDQGCTRVLAVGRKGWIKVLSRQGFSHRMTALTRVVQ